MVLKRIGPLSAGKLSGLIFAVIGVFVGILFSLFGLLGFFAGSFESDGPAALLGILFGFGSIIIFPILYGLLGFIQGVAGALLYNLFARVVGGIEMDLQ